MSETVFRVNHLHLKGLRAIREFDLPRQGPGWNGHFPDCVMLGGANGSGKTSLLEFVVQAASYLVLGSACAWHQKVEAATIDFEVCGVDLPRRVYRYSIGDDAYVRDRRTEDYFGYVPGTGTSEGTITPRKTFKSLALAESADDARRYPALLYLPSEGRELILAQTQLKAGGKLARPREFVNVWRPSNKWEESLEAVLYAARWEDLNAREEGREEDTDHFAQFAKAFEFFCGEKKTISWHRGELVIEIRGTGERHDIHALSSGEKQVLLLTTELLLRWRPGSLVLIDEPELHLHPAWQVRLWQALQQWQRERGGQVIVATQSSEMFGLAAPGTT